MSKEISPQKNVSNPISLQDASRVFNFVAKNSKASDGKSFFAASRSYFKSEPKKAKDAYLAISQETDLERRSEILDQILKAKDDNKINDTAFRVFSNILEGIFGSNEDDEKKQKAVDRIIEDFKFLSNHSEQNEKEISSAREDFDKVYLDISLFSDDNNPKMADLIKNFANEENKSLIEKEIEEINKSSEIEPEEQEKEQEEQEKEEKITKDQKNKIEDEENKEKEKEKEKNNKSKYLANKKKESPFDNITYSDIALGTLGSAFLASVPFTGPVGILFAGLTYAYAASKHSKGLEEKNKMLEKIYKDPEIKKLLEKDEEAKKFFEEAKNQDDDLKEVVEKVDKENLKQQTAKKEQTPDEELKLEEVELEEVELEEDKNIPNTTKEIAKSANNDMDHARKGLERLLSNLQQIPELKTKEAENPVEENPDKKKPAKNLEEMVKEISENITGAGEKESDIRAPEATNDEAPTKQVQQK